MHLKGRGKGRENESKNLRETKTAITQGLVFPKKKDSRTYLKWQ